MSLCDCRTSNESVGGAVSKVDISDAQRMSQLFAASLASVRRPDLHAVLQPSVQDVVTVDVDLKGDRVFLLSIQVLEGLGDEDGWKTPDGRQRLDYITAAKSTRHFYLVVSTNLKSRCSHIFWFW